MCWSELFWGNWQKKFVNPCCKVSLHITHHNTQQQHSGPFHFIFPSFATFYSWKHFASSTFSSSQSTVGDIEQEIYATKTPTDSIVSIFLHEENRLCGLFMPYPLEQHRKKHQRNISWFILESKCGDIEVLHLTYDFFWGRWALKLSFGLGLSDRSILQKWAISIRMDSYPAESRTDASLDYHSSPHAFTLHTKTRARCGPAIKKPRICYSVKTLKL